MFARVIEIDDLDGLWKMQIRLIPNPFGSVPQHHFFLRSRPTPLPGFGIQSAAEFLTVLDRSYIAGRGFVPYGIAFFINGGLCEYAAQLGLARAPVDRPVCRPGLHSPCALRECRCHPSPRTEWECVVPSGSATPAAWLAG